MKKNNHLPLYGVGPLYVISIIFLTILGCILSNFGLLNSGKIILLKIPFAITGTILIISGIIIWVKATLQEKIFNNIKDNKLVKTGIYAYVRNPIYSAFLIACTGVILLENNLWLIILPVIFWALMTILMKNTEEKWLTNSYGKEYIDYCKCVNRCIPWFNRGNKNKL